MLVHLAADRDEAKFLEKILAQRRKIAQVALGFAIAAVLIFQNTIQSSLQLEAAKRGLWSYSEDEDLVARLLALPEMLLARSEPLKRLDIEIDFKAQRKLHQKRAAAIKRGILVTEENDFVSVKVRGNEKKVPARLRLKGDWLDHAFEDKPSYRIQVRGPDHLYGLRRFSIQHPITRGFQSEALFHEALRYYGILAPRYFFADTWVNGQNIGIMAVEEHFSKELLESQGRRESVILKLDERQYWESWGRNIEIEDGIFNDYRIAPIVSFQEGKIARSPELQELRDVAIGLFRGFRNKTLSSSEVFEPSITGKYLAIADVFGAYHALLWQSQRFYYDPLIGKLEPIGYDANLQHRLRPGDHKRRASDFVVELLEDDSIWRSYVATVHQLSKDLSNGEFRHFLQEREQQLFNQLAPEFIFLSRFPLDETIERAAKLAVTISRLASLHYNAFSQLDEDTASQRAVDWLNAYLVQKDGKSYLEIVPAVGFAVEVSDVRRASVQGETVSNHRVVAPSGLPLHLPAREFYSRPESFFVPLQKFEHGSDSQLEVLVRRKTDGSEKVVQAISHVIAREDPIVPKSTLASQLKTHDFLEFSKGRLRIRPGQWEVTSDIIVPAGVTLEVPPATTLSFGAESALIAHGPIDFIGERGHEIVLQQNGHESTATWPGLVVLQAQEPSRLSNVVIRNTRGIDRDGWILTGGATFYRSDVILEFSRFENHQGEDALNIVSSNFDLREVMIENTLSDGFDSDFSDGFVTASRFERIGSAGGGDAIDVSGSDIVVVDSVFENVADKAVSVGEGSTARVSRSSMSHVGTGLASKDGSTLEAVDITIDNPRLAGAMAYIKKPEYGAARIEGRNLVVHGDGPVALAQTGSEILLDERSVAAQDLNVEELYQTVMKPGLRK